MKRLWMVILLLIPLISIPTTRVLVIYESDYEDESIIDLPLAKKDAMNVFSLFKSLPNTKVKLLENPTIGKFIKDFKDWVRATKGDDTFVFYYAGHGMTKDGEFYFIPSDADPEDTFTWIAFSRIKRYVPENMRVIWLIDACYSGSIVEGRPLRAGRIQRESLKVTKEEAILVSSSGDEISREVEGGGAFTVALVDGLRGDADLDGDGWIDFGELEKFVKNKVKELTGGRQNPVGKGREDLRITKNLKALMDRIKFEVFKMYDAGELSESEYENLRAYLGGENCEVLEELEEAIKEYISGSLNLKGLKLVLKSSADDIRCGIETSHKGVAVLKLKASNELALGADVYVDGKRVGKLEKETKIELLAGKHEIRITSPKMEEMVFEIEVQAYEIYEKEIYAKVAERKVRIESVPEGAKVYVDGRLEGKTPLEVNLEVGKDHEIKLVKPGYYELKRKIYIPSKGDEIKRRYTLKEAPPGVLRIRTKPEGAKVYIDGEYVGKSPVEVEFDRNKEVNVKVEKKGYKEEEKKAKVYIGKVKELFIKLIRENLSKISPKIIWQKTLGGSDWDVAYSAIETTDGGYLVVGETWSTDGDIYINHGLSDAWIVKLSKNGELMWEKTLGGTYGDQANFVIRTLDGGYLVVGNTSSKIHGNKDTVHHGDEDIWIIKISKSGNVVWQKIFGGSRRDKAYSVIQTSDKGYLIVGETTSNDGDVHGWHEGYGENGLIYPDMWIVKLSEDGEIIWQRTIGGSGWDVGYSVIETRNEEYLVVGETFSKDGDVTYWREGYGGACLLGACSDVWFVKLSKDGKIIWEKTFGGSSEDRAYSITQTSDGNYIIAGETWSRDGDIRGTKHGWYDMWVLKISENGNIIWQKTLGGDSCSVANSVIETSDGGYLIVGWTNSNGGNVTGWHEGYGIDAVRCELSECKDAWIVKLSKDGKLLWQKTLGGKYDDVANSVIETEEGDYVVVGWTASDNGDVKGYHGAWDMWVVKLGY